MNNKLFHRLAFVFILVSLVYLPLMSQAQDTNTSSKLPNAGPNCPENPPASGPASGEDYRRQVAQAFEETLNIISSASETENDAHGGYSGNLPQTNNRIAEVAKGEIGYQGHGPCPGGKLDRTKYYAGGNACVQWCSAFVTWTIRKAGYSIPAITSSRATLSWFKSNGHSVFANPAQAGPGDIVVWGRGPNTGHIGIVVANDGTTITTVEGNTSRDKVKPQTYSHSSIRSGLLGFGRW